MAGGGGGGDCNHGTQKEIAPSLILLYNISKRIPAQLLFALLLVGLLIHNHWTPSAHISHQPREFSLSLSRSILYYIAMNAIANACIQKRTLLLHSLTDERKRVGEPSLCVFICRRRRR